MENYLDILENSLRRKSEVLDRIQDINRRQLLLLEEEEMSMEQYDALVDEKSECIDALNKLDDGFEVLYQNIARELEQNRTRYAEQIKRLQALIREVTDKGVEAQAQEARNKEKVVAFFAKQRQQLKHARVSSKAALDYYQNMNNMKNVQAQFMDKKK